MKISLPVVSDFYRPDKEKAIPSGIVVYTYGLAKELAKRGHEVSVLSLDWEHNGPRKYDMDGFKVEVLTENAGRIGNMDFSYKVHAWLQENPQDVIEAHNYLYPLLIEQLVGGTPTVIRFASDSISAAKVGSYDPGGKTRQEVWSQQLLEIESVGRAEVVMCASTGLIQRLRSNMIGSEQVPLGIPEVVKKKDLVKAKDRDGVLILVSRFSDARKGGEFVPSILSQIPPKVPVVIVGEEVDAARRKELRNLRKDAVWYFDPVSDEKLRELYSTVSVTIVPSKAESFGLVLLEPMAYGCPVMCFLMDDPEKASWPLWRIGPPGHDSLMELGRMLDKAEKLPQPEELANFAQGFLWENLVCRYEEVYSTAVAKTLSKGRIRGW